MVHFVLYTSEPDTSNFQFHNSIVFKCSNFFELFIFWLHVSKSSLFRSCQFSWPKLNNSYINWDAILWWASTVLKRCYPKRMFNLLKDTFCDRISFSDHLYIWRYTAIELKLDIEQNKNPHNFCSIKLGWGLKASPPKNRV